MAKVLVIKFVTDIAKASRDIDRLTSKIDRIKVKTAAGKIGTEGTAVGGGFFRAMVSGESGLGAVGSALSNLGGAAGNLISSFFNLNPAIVAVTAAFLGLKFVLQKTFEFGNLVEGAKIQMELFTGSMQKTSDIIKAARRFSLITPFGPAEVLGATASALQFGIDPYGKNKYGLKGEKTAMDIIGGLASFRNPMTGESIGMNRAAYAVAGGDTRLLRPFGSDVRAAYETAKGAGPLRSAAFTSKFLEELGKLPKVLNMAKAQSDSMAGMWSTIAGFAEEFFMSLSGAGEQKGVITFWSQLEEIVMDVRDAGMQFTSYIMPYITEAGTYMGAVFKYLWDILKQIWAIVGPVIIPAFKIMVQLLRIVWEVSRAIMNTFIGLVKVFWAIISLPLKLVSALFGVSTSIENVIKRLMNFVSGMQATFILLRIFIEGIVESVTGAVDSMIKKFGEALDYLGLKISKLIQEYPMLTKVLDTVVKIGGYTPQGLILKGVASVIGDEDSAKMLRPNDYSPSFSEGIIEKYTGREKKEIPSSVLSPNIKNPATIYNDNSTKIYHEPRWMPEVVVPNANRK